MSMYTHCFIIISCSFPRELAIRREGEIERGRENLGRPLASRVYKLIITTTNTSNNDTSNNSNNNITISSNSKSSNDDISKYSKGNQGLLYK